MFQFAMPYREAAKIAKKLAHSMSTEETRYYLMGFFMHKAEDGKHYAVSTNGHILTRIEVRLDDGYEGEFPAAIFPAEAVKQIERIKLSAADKKSRFVNVRVDAAQHRYEIECMGQVAGGKLIDGTYPDYTRVIPSGWREYGNTYQGKTSLGNDNRVGFNARYLAAIMKAAAYNPDLLKEAFRPVQFHFEGGNPAVVVETADPAVLYVIMPTRV